MKYKIKATGINLSGDINDYLDKRLQSIEKLIDINNPTLLVEVELGRTTRHHQSGDFFRAEINLSIDGRSFRAVSEKESLDSAIDEIRDEMANVLRSYKGKQQSLFKRSGARIKEVLRKFYK